MIELPPALLPLGTYVQFILHKIVQRDNGKTDKLPVDHNTLNVMKAGLDWQNNSIYWTTADNAIKLTNGNNLGISFLLTPHDPFFCIDIDNCLINNVWSETANTLIKLLSGAAVEVSHSGCGLHIFGTGKVPEHTCKNTELGIELYTEKRPIALTGLHTHGLASADCAHIMPAIVSTYFTPNVAIRNVAWTTKPLPEWTTPGNDEDLLKKALASSSNAVKFGIKASFRDLWERNSDVLIEMYPPLTKGHPWDQSSADAALAQHLAFWTGCNCDHMWILMWQSQLRRDKWRWHKTFLQMTITRAASLCNSVYTSGDTDLNASAFNVPKLVGSAKAIKWAEKIREEKLHQSDDDSLLMQHGPATQAGFWIDHKDLSPKEISILAQPASTEPLVTLKSVDDKPLLRTGFQYLSADKQIEHFIGCTYVQDAHRILTPNGALLKSEQFNATYGGYVFQLSSESSGKCTRKAYEAFTESQAVSYAMAESVSFRPDLPAQKLFNDEGVVIVNSYNPVETRKIKGCVTPFLTHLNKLIPDDNDKAILLAYMAACIQHKGHKFQWAPLIQGSHGNGKTLFTRCVAFAIGKKYTHMPFASEITEKYNDWLFGNIFIGVEDVFVSEHKQEIMEILKPMISNDQLAIRAMRESQHTATSCANFMLNMNSKTGFKIDPNERRYAPFFTAQQCKADLKRDGLDGNYFPKLYNWLRDDGYAIINYYLTHYDIPLKLNPAVTAGGECHKAPITTSVQEALSHSLGGVEQEIIEAVDQEKIGFCGGWISSTWLDRLLTVLGVARRIPHNRRYEILQSLGYIYHPGLVDGRVNNMIMIDNARSRLFVKVAHPSGILTSSSEIAKAYGDAQPLNFS